jgi:hypothetical protein
VKSKKIKYKDQFLPLRKWKGLLKNYPCFILGNGLSISSCNLELIKNYFTIGINRIFYAFDPIILMWQDLGLWRHEKNKILNTKAIKICTKKSDPRDRFIHYTIKRRTKFSGNPTLLGGKGNTGILAVQFAYALGCNPIILLGMDCQYKIHSFPRSYQTDFYGFNKFHTFRTIINCKKYLEWLYQNCPSGTRIFNCGEGNLVPTWNFNNILNRFPIKKKYNRNYFENILKSENN